MSTTSTTLPTAAVLGVLAMLGPASAQAPRSPTPDPVAAPVRAVPVASGLERPWAVAFLPDGRALVTEKAGRLRFVGPDGAVSAPLGGVPAVDPTGQGGLLDVALDPGFAENRLVYLSYAEPGEGGAGTAVARGRLSDAGLEGVQVIYRQQPKVAGGNHYGSRLVFAPDGTLFITQGDRFNYKEQAQNPTSLIGKVARINRDGSIPPDNPFVGRWYGASAVSPEIWSMGHRNVQSAAIDPATGQLWTVEHGARGGDELNHPQWGRNYGWPTISYGVEYDGSTIGVGTAAPELEQPAYYWDPVIAPSGMTFLTSDAYPGWRGSAFVGSLGRQLLVRLVIEGGQVVQEERLLGDLGQRVRDVQEGPGGLLYLLTDEGQLLRLEPTGGG